VIEFLKSKLFLKHAAAAFIVIALVLFAAFKFISTYTLHGKTIEVPDIKGLTLQAAAKAIEEKELRYSIVDSIYDADNKPGTVVEQNPSPLFKVKQNRTVYLTVNAFNPPKVQMPNLIDVSLRQASAMLETYGLEVGNLKYVPDYAYNAVLKQLYKGREIAVGTQIMKNSKIDLVLGDGLKGEKIPVPNLIGMTREEAESAVKAHSLDLGAMVYDNTVKDSLQAKVYKQTPAFSSSAMINPGRSIDLFFTEDEAKISIPKQDTLVPDEEVIN
jgi:beta-lactam-binding protein with PASTA domain